jgi:hypothetical protein
MLHFIMTLSFRKCNSTQFLILGHTAKCSVFYYSCGWFVSYLYDKCFYTCWILTWRCPFGYLMLYGSWSYWRVLYLEGGIVKCRSCEQNKMMMMMTFCNSKTMLLVPQNYWVKEANNHNHVVYNLLNSCDASKRVTLL